MTDAWETFTAKMKKLEHCPKSEDNQHCDHWWDNEGPCHYCGDDSSLASEEI